jgi:hypothetical protein
MPVHHIVDDKIGDQSLFFEQRKDLPVKGILQILCRKLRPLDERAVSVKTAVRGDNVEMGVKILEITARSHRRVPRHHISHRLSDKRIRLSRYVE